MPLLPNDKEIIKKSLVHYFQKLDRFSTEEELMEITKEDLMKEFRAIGRTQDELEQPPKYPAEDYYSYSLNDKEHNRVISSALKYYVKDLETSKLKVKELYDDAILLSSTDENLKLANETLKKIPLN